MWLEWMPALGTLGDCGRVQRARPCDSNSRVSLSNGRCLFRRKNPREASTMIRLAVSRTMLVLALLFTSQKGRFARAYYYEYPTTLFGRTQNYHHYQGRKEDYLARKFLTRKSGITILASSEGDEEASERSDGLSDLERDLLRRITILEALVSKQEMEIHRLKKSNEELKVTTEAFAQVIKLLREAGLESNSAEGDSKDAEEKTTRMDSEGNPKSTGNEQSSRVVESFDDSMIFGTAPSSVNDAADAAGAAILAAMLGGKQRMLVDVRDAELSSDPETLVQFIELAILPVAAGLEGLRSTRNRVKIVFPKVSQLLEYRRTMALAAPEVVALSTLGFDPVERRDKLVVIVAPEPDDEEGLVAMRELLYPSDSSQSIQQPIVILNYHMVPVAGIAGDFETAYHLRLLSVQFMSGEMANEILSKSKSQTVDDTAVPELEVVEHEDTDEVADASSSNDSEDDKALEAAMKHAHELGTSQGFTRAMVIRAYPRPWHVFVDTAPDTDTDFEVAATFDEEPSLEEINMAIVECLEGSEREDELVAQQMQQALEDGQLDRVSDMIGKVLDFDDEEDASDEDDDENDFDIFAEDSV